jgi:hypothetical protein
MTPNRRREGLIITTYVVSGICFRNTPPFVARARGLRSRVNFLAEQAARLLHKSSPPKLDDS